MVTAIFSPYMGETESLAMSSKTKSASSELTSGQKGFTNHHAENHTVAPLMLNLEPVNERLTS